MPKPVAAADLAAADRPARRGQFRVAVVLGDEHHRQVPDFCEIVAFQHRALVGGAVAVEADADAARLQRLRRQRRAADQRRAGADDAVRAEHALRQVGDVHGAALAAAEPVLAPENLVHHAVDVAALGDAMAVAAMRRGDGVAVVEMHADADARRLLAGIEMHEAGNVAGGKFRRARAPRIRGSAACGDRRARSSSRESCRPEAEANGFPPPYSHQRRESGLSRSRLVLGSG